MLISCDDVVRIVVPFGVVEFDVIDVVDLLVNGSVLVDKVVTSVLVFTVFKSGDLDVIRVVLLEAVVSEVVVEIRVECVPGGTVEVICVVDTVAVVVFNVAK